MSFAMNFFIFLSALFFGYSSSFAQSTGFVMGQFSPIIMSAQDPCGGTYYSGGTAVLVVAVNAGKGEYQNSCMEKPPFFTPPGNVPASGNPNDIIQVEAEVKPTQVTSYTILKTKKNYSELKFTYMLYTIDGRVLKSGSPSSLALQAGVQFDLSSYTPGTYAIALQTSQGQKLCFKLIKI